MDIVGYGRMQQEHQGPPRAPGYRGDKRWIVQMEKTGVVLIYAPTKEAAIVHAAPHFGYRWQSWEYLARVSAFETKQK